MVFFFSHSSKATFIALLNSQTVYTGCGNGKYLGVNNSLYISGSDICPELVTIAKRRGHEVMISDCLSLPYKSGVFDAVICIAVLHHLSTEERRRQGIEEVQRIMRPGGRGLVYVWAMEQERKKVCRLVLVLAGGREICTLYVLYVYSMCRMSWIQKIFSQTVCLWI